MTFYDSPVPVMLALIVLSAWGFWLLFRRHKVTAELAAQRAEVFNRLLEKFASANEFIAFIGSEQGRKLFENVPERSPRRPLWTVIRMIQGATLLTFVSIFFFVDAFLLHGGTDINEIRAVRESIGIGVFFLTVGAALFACAGLGSYFGRRWGLLESPKPDVIVRS